MDLIHWVFVFTSSLLQIKQIMPSGIYFCQAAAPHFFDFQVKKIHHYLSGNRSEQRPLESFPIRLFVEKW
jgi:hypothetical protein